MILLPRGPGTVAIQLPVLTTVGLQQIDLSGCQIRGYIIRRKIVRRPLVMQQHSTTA